MPNEEAQPNEASLHGGYWWSSENDCGSDPGASPSEEFLKQLSQFIVNLFVSSSSSFKPRDDL